MSEPFIAEVRIFAGNFAPRGWAFCSGQLLPIAQNTALFSLVGTTYGGDGRTTFGLPNLQGRAPMHPGNGPGLTMRHLGEHSGATTATLTTQQMAGHSHGREADDASPSSGSPAGRYVAAPYTDYEIGAGEKIYRAPGDLVPFGESIGGGQSHTNLQPYLVLNFVIALVGMYPSRS